MRGLRRLGPYPPFAWGFPFVTARHMRGLRLGGTPAFVWVRVPFRLMRATPHIHRYFNVHRPGRLSESHFEADSEAWQERGELRKQLSAVELSRDEARAHTWNMQHVTC